MGYYESNQNFGKESGAYVFSPKSEKPILPEVEECFIFQENEWLELHAFYQPGFGYVAKKSLKQPHWDIEWFVQPIDVSDRCVCSHQNVFGKHCNRLIVKRSMFKLNRLQLFTKSFYSTYLLSTSRALLCFLSSSSSSCVICEISPLCPFS